MAFVHFDREQVIEVRETPDEVRDLTLNTAPEYAPMIRVTLAHEGEQIFLNARTIRALSDGPVSYRVPVD